MRFKKESWKPLLPNKTYYPFFISNLGNIIYLSRFGYFKDVKQYEYKDTGRLVAPILIKTDKNKLGYKSNHLYVDMLVCRTFLGGYYKRRSILHKDDNLKNNKLKNLKWKYGFTNGIDYKYINELNDSLMTEENVLLKNYLITKNIKFIYDIIGKHKNLIYHIFSDYKLYNEYKNFMSEFPLKLKTIIDDGKVKPHHKGDKYNIDCVITIIKVNVRLEIKKFFINKNDKIVNYNDLVTSKPLHLLNKFNDLISDNQTISEEIEEMFKNYCN